MEFDIMEFSRAWIMFTQGDTLNQLIDESF